MLYYSELCSIVWPQVQVGGDVSWTWINGEKISAKKSVKAKYFLMWISLTFTWAVKKFLNQFSTTKIIRTFMTFYWFLLFVMDIFELLQFLKCSNFLKLRVKVSESQIKTTFVYQWFMNKNLLPVNHLRRTPQLSSGD